MCYVHTLHDFGLLLDSFRYTVIKIVRLFLLFGIFVSARVKCLVVSANCRYDEMIGPQMPKLRINIQLMKIYQKNNLKFSFKLGPRTWFELGWVPLQLPVGGGTFLFAKLCPDHWSYMLRYYSAGCNCARESRPYPGPIFEFINCCG